MSQSRDQGKKFLCDTEAANACALGLREERKESDDFLAEQLRLTRVRQALGDFGDQLRIEVVSGVEQQLDVYDELLGSHDAVNIGAIAHVQQHVGNACGRLLLECGQSLPDPIDFCFNLLFLLSYILTDGICGVAFGSVHALDDGLAGGVQSHVPVLVDHVAFGMPMLVLAIAVDLDELLEDGCLAAVAALGKLGRVVIVAVNATFMLVVAVRGAEHGGTYRAGEVLDVVFALEGGNVRAAEGLSALVAQQVESAEVVGLAERVLARGLLGDGEELGGDNLAAVLEIVSVVLVEGRNAWLDGC